MKYHLAKLEYAERTCDKAQSPEIAAADQTTSLNGTPET
jgi:hypothetical protein